MIFRPTKVSDLWDTWLYHHDNIHWLFFLHKSDGKRWDGISLARSSDGVHYEEIGTVVERSPDADWLGSGSICRLRDGRFVMNLSEMRRGAQSIFFLESRDLQHWRRLDDRERLAPDPRWYDDTPSGRWDGICVLERPGGGYVGYLTARPWSGPDDPEYVSVGKLESDDAIHWRAVAPPRFEWGELPESDVYEVGAVERVGGMYRMMICAVGSERRLGRRTAWSAGVGDAGMYAFRSASIDGPFSPDGPSYRLLTSPSWLPGGLPYAGMSHFTRFYRIGDDVLVNHHSIEYCGDGSNVWFAPLKRARAGSAGELQLAWWEGNDRLKGESIRLGVKGGEAVLAAAGEAWREADGMVTASAPSSGGIFRLGGRFDPAKGVVVEFRCRLKAAPRTLGSAGIAVGHPAGEGIGTAFLMGTRGRTDIGVIDRAGSVLPQNVVEKGIGDSAEERVRLLVKRGMCELYRDDELLQCYSLPALPTGELYLVFEGGSVTFGDLHAWRMS